MYSFFHGLLSDKTGGEIFTLFGLWHFFYVGLTVVLIAVFLYFLKNKDESVRQNAVKRVVQTVFCIYIADFFLMPLAYGEIDIDKLPFHACTSMCVMCNLSYYIKRLEKYRMSFVLLGLISNLVYLLYPAGVMWYEIHPCSYRVVQTLLFHSLMTVYGVLMVVYNYNKLELEKYWRNLFVIVCLTLWALLGSYTYSADVEGYSHSFNWFFVVHDPLNAIPERLDPFVMPFLNIAVFLGCELILYFVVWCVKRAKK